MHRAQSDPNLWQLYTASNGVFQCTLTGHSFNLLSPATSGSFTLYLVSDSQGFAIETDNEQPSLVHLQALKIGSAGTTRTEE